MDEEQEMERFDLEGEFVDGEFVDGEFYSRGRRRGRVQTKEEALYGYDSDSDREERRSKKQKRNKIVGGDRMGKAMNFVSAGAPGSPPEPQNAGASNSKSGEEPNAGSPPEPGASNSKPGEESNERSGLGFGNSGSGLGFDPSSDTGDDQNAGNSGFGLGYSAGVGLGFQPDPKGGGEDAPVLDTPLGRKILENVQKKAPPATRNTENTKPSFNWVNSGNAAASRMMAKMGWNPGKGLGKNEEGRTHAIKTNLRPKGLGLGFGDLEENTGPRSDEEKEDDHHDLQAKPKNEKLWKKKNRNKVKEHVSAEELLRRQEEKGGGGRVVERVLDMTGKQVRVVTDMRNLRSEPESILVEDDDTPMPELQHNVRLLVDLVESDLRHYDSKLRHEKQTVEILRRDQERLEKQLDLQSGSLEVMQGIMAVINEVSSRRMTPEGVAGVFRKLKEDHPEEYKAWNLSAIALSHALPLTSPRFHGWQPLVQPSREIETLLLWREVFEEDDEPIFVEVDTSPFTRLVVEAVMPHIRRAVVNWEVRDPEPLVRFLELWEKLLPIAVLNNILDHLVMPKLSAAVEAWNPLQDTIPVHEWVHPWLPLLRSRIDPICGVIRVKLDHVLEAWNPSDSSALLMLSPWYPVFDSESWDQLLLRKIIPKLNYALDLLVINPAQQQLEPFNWVISWANYIPAGYMIRMLEERFFPKWRDVLFHWLRSNPDFVEVSQWYEGWKSIIPPELLANDRVRWQLNGALQLMNQAVDGVPLEMASVLQQQQKFEAPKYHHPILQQQQQQVIDVEEVLSLKDVLEGFAAENDVRFLPKVGRMHEGLQVYGFGSVSVSVDNHKQVILAQSGEKWSSVSLGDLLEMNRARKGVGKGRASKH